MARLAALLGPRSGPVERLGRGITNRSIKATFGEGEYVVQVSGPYDEQLGIDRESECAANLRAGELGIAPRVAVRLHEPHCLVTDYAEASALSAEQLREPDRIAAVARALRAMHDSAEALPSGHDPFRAIERLAAVARDAGVTLPAGADRLMVHLPAVEQVLRRRADATLAPCHNDLMTANLLDANGRLLIVDWEYAGMGDPCFDLASFSAHSELDVGGIDVLLRAYFAEEPAESLRAALRLMSFVSSLWEAAWSAAHDALSGQDTKSLAQHVERHVRRADAFAAGPELTSSLEAAGGS